VTRLLEEGEYVRANIVLLAIIHDTTAATKVHDSLIHSHATAEDQETTRSFVIPDDYVY
jgi:hypothetical protein